MFTSRDTMLDGNIYFQFPKSYKFAYPLCMTIMYILWLIFWFAVLIRKLMTEVEIERFKNWPVFVKGKTDYSFEEVVNILLSEHNTEQICEKQPMNCQINAAFLIDITKIQIKNLPFDDNGSYSASGSHTWTYKLVETEDTQIKLISKKRQALTNPGERYIYLRRIYRTSKGSQDFKQIVSYLEDEHSNILNNLALLQYNFKGPEHNFEIKAHGNSKDPSTPFLPTNKTTKEVIREAATKMKPKKAILSLTKSQDLLNATSSAEMTRDRKQAYNMKYTASDKKESMLKKDELYAVILQAANEQDQGEETFIHSITSWPEPMCILGLKYQFHDITRFCCNPSLSYHLTADTTFNLGNFYVTPLSYRNLNLESKRTGKSPLFLGPILVHITRSYCAYSHLLAKLKELEPAVDDLRAIMTDGEPGLIKAIATFFLNTTPSTMPNPLQEEC